MTAIIEYLFHPLPNAVMTILVGLSALYWLLTFISGDFLGDLDVDLDSGVDVDSDGDVDTTEPSLFSKALSFINIGKVPIMVVISTFKFIAWIFTLASTMVWNIGMWGWKSVLILIPIFIITYFLTKVFTTPLIKIYKSMGYNGEEKHDLIGRIAIMKSDVTGDKLGNAEVVILKDVIRVVVKSKSGQTIAYNAEVNIVAEGDSKKYYLVEPEITVHNILGSKS